MNEQAAAVAASVLSESVVAATRCEQITQEMTMEAAGLGAGMRGMAKVNRKIGFGMAKGMGMGKMVDMAGDMRTGGLPSSFVLAVTDSQVHALEDKQKGGNLVAGKVLKSWDREGLMARAGAAVGVSATDRQVLTLFLPMEGGKNRYMAAAAAQMAQAGAPGMPHRFLIATDPPSQAVVDAIASREALGDFAASQLQSNPALAARFPGGAAAMASQAAGGESSVDRLAKLAELRASGALTDAEFEVEKAKIIGSA